ncbi:NLR family CARD domain-containing protein 3 [Nematolebias whitei]|uniref:NLR family CARD domain-containing protein 3 n=1 Tax=Nematolebias whitei TaxID=451745 RepID=UPI0018977586|nr:NLR family CARD domain-containing protein 3 [Nematolebias whitei]
MIQRLKPEFPDPSCVCCRTDEKKDLPVKDFKGQTSNTMFRLRKPEPPDPSCVSLKSNESKSLGIFFNDKTSSSETIIEPQQTEKVLSPDFPECLWSQREEEEAWEDEDVDEWTGRIKALITIKIHLKREIEQSSVGSYQRELKAFLKKKFQCVFEGINKTGTPTLLDQIYTELYITEGGTAEANGDHEVRLIETSSRKPNGPKPTIRREDIFKVPPGRDEPIRTVMTKGVAGIGKTVLTQKLTLDWAEDRTNQDIQFIFPFTFRELNVLQNKKFSLVELLHHFFTETKDICSFEEFQILFILDGLDECRLPLDFLKNQTLTDITESSSVDVLLTNLIMGNLLPSARLWITTRPAAANQIPAECVGMVTEVRGFADPQKEEYFRKRFRDEEQARRIISHIKSSRTLHNMCHIPVFCWITATVLEDVLKTREGSDLPKSLTEMYIHFLLVQTKVKKIKYDGGAEKGPENKTIIGSLGKLAFEQLQKGNLVFYESDLKECGIDIRDASVYSGVFTQIFKEERGLYQDKVFCFVHLSVQEFLAALHVHLTFITSGDNLMGEKQTFRLPRFSKPKLTNLHNSAVDEALKSPNGHLDLFLRFLLGLSLQTNQKLLQGLLDQTGSSSQTNQETVQHIKKMISEGLSAERSINLFHCLNELNDRSLVEDIQQSMSSGRLCPDKLSPAQWSALVFILLSSEEHLDVFDLKKYSTSGDVLLRLLPVVKASIKADLSFCALSQRSVEALSSVLSTDSSRLRELDLSNNNLRDSDLRLVSAGLQSPNCRLESLRLSGCFLSDERLDVLLSPLRLQSFGLRELDLSNNNLQDPGVELLAEGLKSSNWKLETLRLSLCNLSETSCASLSSVLSSRSTRLKELDLSNNDLKDSGVKLLSAGLQSSNCRLEVLRLSGCLVTDDGCASLAAALSSDPSRLRELDLSYNHPGDSGVKLLSAQLQDPQSKLETFRTDPAGIQWLKPGLRKYFCELSFNTNTINGHMKVSDDNTEVWYEEQNQSYPDHPEQFFRNHQLLCSDGLTGRCYWEVELTGGVHTSVSYQGIARRGEGNDGWFGGNDQSWTLFYDGSGYSVWHDKKGTSVLHSSSSSDHRVAVFVDFPAGTLSFYRVSSDSLIHLHTFRTKFTEPLYPGFGLWCWFGAPLRSSVRLVSPQK